MPGVLLDVDGTLFAKPSSEALFIRFLARRGQLRPAQIRAALGFFIQQGRTFGKHTPQKNKAYLSGLSCEQVHALAAKFVERVLARRFRRDVLERVRMHQRRRDPLVLLTGTPDFLAEPIARHLGAEHCTATVCAQHQGRFTSAAPVQHPFGIGKVRAAENLCMALNTTLDQCIAYADSVYDIPLLERAGHPVAVYPDRQLTRMARQRNWEILGTGLDPHTAQARNLLRR